LIRHVTTSGLGSAPVDYVPTNMISAIKSGWNSTQRHYYLSVRCGEHYYTSYLSFQH
jgi:hypothetical protein